MGSPGLDEYARYTVLASDVRSLRDAVDAINPAAAHLQTGFVQ